MKAGVGHLELVEGVVAKLGARIQEPGFEHADRRAGGDGVKVLDDHLLYCLPRVVQGHPVDVAVFALHAEGSRITKVVDD